MDMTEPAIEALLQTIKPHAVFFDFTPWLPALARRLGIKSVHFVSANAVTVAYAFREGQTTDDEFKKPPIGFPSSTFYLYTHEAIKMNSSGKVMETGTGITFRQRLMIGTKECDAIGFKSCREMEGPYCDYIESKFQKPVILAGPVVTERLNSALDEKWKRWLDGFEDKSVVYCAFGSEVRIQKGQFQELILGLEMSGRPFFAALKPPVGFDSIDEALPDGFRERTQERGIVHGGWVQQQLILAHPAVGCFVTHCGSGSLTEALLSDCQIVLAPQFFDQFLNARLMSRELKVGVEVEKGDEDGLFTKTGVSEAVKMVMDPESEIGKEVRANHAKLKESLSQKGLESSYIDEFVDKLRALTAEGKPEALHITER